MRPEPLPRSPSPQPDLGVVDEGPAAAASAREPPVARRLVAIARAVGRVEARGEEGAPEDAVERARRDGVDRASASDLLALVLGRGRAGPRRVRRAAGAIERLGGLRRASHATLDEWVACGGVPPRASLAACAAFALGRRAHARPLGRGVAFTSPDQIFARYHAALRDLRKERFLCVLVDAKNRIIREEMISEGGLTSAPAVPREAFGPAVREGASGVIFLHNHPSGDPEPSDVDLQLTLRLVRAGEILGIRVLDHIVIADAGFVSFLERGVVPASS